MSGKVLLVGAGPGDMSLMSRKGFKAVGEADCLIYDALVDNQILNYIKPSCEKIFVGKRKSHHTLKQGEINQLLVDKAQSHKLVVRLKGGDVYVFGRGGEEGSYLTDHNVKFEVVPGISSAIAGLAYAGIPITHRGVARGFHVYTGHDKDHHLANIDFEHVGKTNDTCVFLMSLSKVENIVDKIIEHGRSIDTPIAIISNATLANQRTLVSTLEKIKDDLKNHPMVYPALIVVGQVINLRDKLNFYEKKELFNTKILLPKVGSKSSSLADELREYGAYVNEIQTSNLIENIGCLDNIDLSNYKYLILTSKNAIDYFINSLKRNKKDIRCLANIKICVTGKQTKNYLEQFNIYPDIVPSIYNSDSLFEEMIKVVNKNDRVLFLHVSNLVNKITKELGNYCYLDEIDLYSNKMIDNNLNDELLNNDFDYLIFNCSSAVINTMKSIDKSLIKDTTIISIGDKTSATLKEYQLDYLQSEEATFKSIINLILKREKYV